MESKQKEAEYRDNQIGSDFTTCPEEECTPSLIQPSEFSSPGRSSLLIIFPTPNCTPCPTQLHFIQIFTTSGLEGRVALGNQHPRVDPIRAQGIQLPVNYLLFRESVTQTVSPVLIEDEDGGSTSRCYFSFPIDLQLLARKKIAETTWPALHF